MMKELNIFVVGIVNKNLGDRVIYDCTAYSIKEIARTLNKKVNITLFSLHSTDYELFQYADAIIFAGGGIIKYRNENIWHLVCDIVSHAQSFNIPVYFNAVGIESYDEYDERCQQLKKAVNKDVVKGISIRDDYDLFINNYKVKEDLVVNPVFDAALWSKEVYDVSVNKTDVIGIGVGRSQLFVEYGNELITDEYLLEYYKTLTQLLDQKGMKWQFFTNGLNSDEKFVNEVLEYIGKDHKDIRAARPVTSSDLIKTISQYKAIIATRMHSNIIAYTYGVPSIGLVWNDKLRLWSQRINYENRFLSNEQIDAGHTFNLLLEILKQDIKIDESFKQQMIHPLKDFIAHIEPRKKDSYPYQWDQKIVAIALGGQEGIYKDLNTVQSLDDYYKKGTRFFECDIRLTSDQKIVCINGWNEKSLGKLGISGSEKLDYNSFMQLKYEGVYKTADLNDILLFLKDHKDSSVIFDIGNGKIKYIRTMISKLEKQISEYFGFIDMIKLNIKNRIYIRIQNSNELLNNQLKCKYQLMIDYNKKKIDFNDYLLLMKSTKLHWVSLEKTSYQEDFIKELKKHNYKIYYFTNDRLTQIIDLYNYVDLIGTHFCDVNQLTHLTK